MDYRPFQAFSPSEAYSTDFSDPQDDPLTLKKRLIDLELSHESERFRLIHDFTVRLREEERRRAELLSKVADLEDARMRLERDLLESRAEIQGNGTQIRGNWDLQDWTGTEKLQKQLRAAESQLAGKREELAQMERQVTALQHESAFLKGEVSKCEDDLSTFRRENATLRLENQRLNRENDRLTAKLQEFVGISSEVPTGEYEALQHRLETTTLKIKSLEELIKRQEKQNETKETEQNRRRSLSRGKSSAIARRNHSRETSTRRIDVKVRKVTARK